MEAATQKFLFVPLNLGPNESLWEHLFRNFDSKLLADAFEKFGLSNARELVDNRNPHSIGGILVWVAKIEVREIGYKLISAADHFVSDACRVEDLHFYFSHRGDFFYRWRDTDVFALDEAIKSYRNQIGMAQFAVPFFTFEKEGFTAGHRGFSQLRIIEEKRQNYTLALALCETAKSQG